MPRNPEYVKAKAYNRWEPKIKWEKPDLGSARRTKPKKEQPGKPKRPVGEEIRDPGDKKGPGKETGPPKAPRGKTSPRGEGPGKDLAPLGDRDGRKGDLEVAHTDPGQERRWGHVEILRPPAIDPKGRQFAPPTPEGPVLEGKLVPKEVGPAPGPVNETHRRQRDFADLVAEVKARQAQKAVGSGSEYLGTGEVVSPGRSSPSSGNTDRSIWTAEVVGHNEGKDTGKIRAIDAPFSAKATGPVPRIHDTAPINITAPLPRTVTETSEIPRLGRQFAMPSRSALTQHAEPLGQMSLFETPGHESPLAQAQAGRSERQSSTPPSMPPGRQVNFMQPNLPKKPGSQGTLFRPVTFKTL